MHPRRRLPIACRALLVALAAGLGGCASQPSPETETQPSWQWRLEPGQRRYVLDADLRPAVYRVCQAPDSGADVAVWLMDRTLNIRVQLRSHALAPGECVVLWTDWTERIVLRPSGTLSEPALGDVVRLRLDWQRLGRTWPGGPWRGPSARAAGAAAAGH